MDTKQTPQTRTNCNSPEFEFWMLRNPSFPQPNLLTADELFVDGVLLPLHLIPTTNNSDPPQQSPNPDPPLKDPDPEPESSPAITESSNTTTFSSSKRWKDIFRKGEKKNITEDKEKENKKKEKKKERKNGSGSTSAELNINIWPFSRSRSAGNTGTRPKLFPPVTRKVNSAPCSRSNSTGESKSRKWPSSPGRAGVHVGRSSPVWQVRRKNSELQPLNPEKASKTESAGTRRSKVVSGAGGKTRVLNLNVPMCIGYRQHLSCRSDESGSVGVSGGAVANGGGECHHDEGSGSNIFNLRNLFTKKSIVTSH